LGIEESTVFITLWMFGLYPYIAAKYNMTFSLEQWWMAGKRSSSALRLPRIRILRVVNFHTCIFFARSKARVPHRGRRNTARQFTAKAACGYDVPMSVGP